MTGVMKISQWKATLRDLFVVGRINDTHKMFLELVSIVTRNTSYASIYIVLSLSYSKGDVHPVDC